MYISVDISPISIYTHIITYQVETNPPIMAKQPKGCDAKLKGLKASMSMAASYRSRGFFNASKQKTEQGCLNCILDGNYARLLCTRMPFYFLHVCAAVLFILSYIGGLHIDRNAPLVLMHKRFVLC